MPTTTSAAAPEPVSSLIHGSSRRREVGSGSARSLLLTVLGEFVHPRSEQVWTGTLVEALGALGVEEKAARQALTRTANEGLLTSSRHGRRVLWDLTESGAELLEAGTQRIYGFMRQRRTWDGQWLVVTVSIPETQRQLRHRFRTRLTWLGLGSPTSGLWITPDEHKERDVHAVIRDLGLDRQAFAWAGPATGIGDESRLIEEAWNLDEVEGRYLDFLAGFEERRAETPRDAFVAQVQMVQEWRRFPFLDPDLPSELLDHDWPGPRAAAVFHDRHSRWHRQAQAEWDRMDAAGGEKP
ncbi:MAG TPA: PaaX family transcriptional regulator C-terminal domain-containing protein [Nocardioidaceae bacterium]|nr:PaaX family transcriptional regulator C-terminal domain-containing protein [Nocardioidaceae bacterium]